MKLHPQLLSYHRQTDKQTWVKTVPPSKSAETMRRIGLQHFHVTVKDVFRPLDHSRKRARRRSSCTCRRSLDPRFRRDTACCTRCRTNRADTRNSRTFGDSSRRDSAEDIADRNPRRRSLARITHHGDVNSTAATIDVQSMSQFQ